MTNTIVQNPLNDKYYIYPLLLVQIHHGNHRPVEIMNLPKSQALKCCLLLHCMVLETRIVLEFCLSTIVTVLL